jgi:hypothetical protein
MSGHEAFFLGFLSGFVSFLASDLKGDTWHGVLPFFFLKASA